MSDISFDPLPCRGCSVVSNSSMHHLLFKHFFNIGKCSKNNRCYKWLRKLSQCDCEFRLTYNRYKSNILLTILTSAFLGGATKNGLLWFCSAFSHYLIFAVWYLSILLNTRGNAKIQIGTFMTHAKICSLLKADLLSNPSVVFWVCG